MYIKRVELMASVLTTIKKKKDVHLFIHNAITTPPKEHSLASIQFTQQTNVENKN